MMASVHPSDRQYGTVNMQVTGNMYGFAVSCYVHLDKPYSLEVETIGCTIRRKHGFHHAPGHDDLTGLQLFFPGDKVSCKPRH